jgi:hypothetical protein
MCVSKTGSSFSSIRLFQTRQRYVVVLCPLHNLWDNLSNAVNNFCSKFNDDDDGDPHIILTKLLGVNRKGK